MHSGFLLKDKNKKSFHLIFFYSTTGENKKKQLIYHFLFQFQCYGITIHGKIEKPHHLKIAGEKG